MTKFIIKRILISIPILIGVSFLVLSILYLTPGDPARSKLGQYASQEDVEALREKWGLNESLPVQYFNYMVKLVQGDMGTTYSRGSSVAADLSQRSKITIPLVLVGLFISIVIGVPLGVYAAVKQYSIVDYTSQALALLLQAVPPFLLGMLLMLGLSLKLGWFPSVGNDKLANYVLPCIACCAGGIAGIIRLTRSSMLEAIRADYVRTARAKGAKEVTVIFKHCLRNALMTVLTSVGGTIALSISGAVVVETVFAMNGIGMYLRDAILVGDRPAVMGCVMLLAVITSVCNLIVDVLYGVIDPRIKAQYAGK